jgi:hypothetical protein
MAEATKSAASRPVGLRSKGGTEVSIELPKPIPAYFTATNSQDIAAMLVPFAEGAIVKDEGQERRGLAAIREWMEETTRKYGVTIAVTDAVDEDGKTVVTVRVSGTFPGSPIRLRYVFTLAGEKISRLEILA